MIVRKILGTRRIRVVAMLCVALAVAVFASACVRPGTWPIGSPGAGGALPGIYRTLGGGGCYWERRRDLSGDFSAIIANGFSSWEPQYVEVKASDAGFSTNGCINWWRYPDGPFAMPLATPGQPFGTGMFMINYEVAPGTYMADGTNCYWSRLRDFSGESTGLITNELSSGKQIVTIAPTDIGFNSSRCGRWVPFASSGPPTQSFADGTFAVNTDIVPGTYSASGQGCYWARLSGFSGESPNLITNHFGSGPTTVAISPSDVGFKTHGCGTWVRIA